MISVTLNNGVEMPILGFGVYQVPDHSECEKSVLTAIETGYRLIDTASAYMNEEAVGKAVEKSGVARENLFITTKLWIQDQGYKKAKIAFEKSLKRLGMEYIDLYLIHQPFGDVYGSWKAMEELYKEGKIRAIGVSNFKPDRLMDLMLHNDIVPAINQVETHPFFQQIETQQFLQDNNVQLESWGPFSEGRNDLFKNSLLMEIGRRYDKSEAQIVLRWLIQRGIVAIPKSVKKERIVENFNVFNFELSSEDMNKIKTLDNGASAFFDHRDPAIVKLLGTTKFDI